MKNICVRITYKSGRYVAVNEDTQNVFSNSVEQAVHDFVDMFLYNNPERKIEIVKAELIDD